MRAEKNEKQNTQRANEQHWNWQKKHDGKKRSKWVVSENSRKYETGNSYSQSK